VNAHYLRSLPGDEFWRRARGFVPEKWLLDPGEGTARKIALLARKRVKVLGDLAAEMAPIVGHEISEDAQAVIGEEWARKVLAELLDALEGRSALSAGGFVSLLGELAKRADTKGKSIFVPVRAAITGRIEGPEMGAVAEVLGAQEVRRRLSRALRGDRAGPGGGNCP